MLCAVLLRAVRCVLCALQTCSQVLLTLDNLADRSQYINARNTFTELLAYGTIPVVNENVSRRQSQQPASHAAALTADVC